MTFTPSQLPTETYLAAACQHKPLIYSKDGRECHFPASVPYRFRHESGTLLDTQALVLAVDNGNDALKGALLDAYEPLIRALRIITAYAPSKVVRAGERPITWRVNGSEEFLIGEDALLSETIEDLPIGLTEERLRDARYRSFLFASLVEMLVQAHYTPRGAQHEYHLFVGFGIPNEEVSLAGTLSATQVVLKTLMHQRVMVERTDEEGVTITWALRLVELTPFPQSLGSFFAWYYRIDGTPIETDILRYVSLDFGGGHLHRADIDILHRPGKRPGMRMTAALLGPGTVAMATALREHIRSQYHVTLELVEARQALVTGYAPINGRRTSVEEAIESIIHDRAQSLLTTILPTIQQGKNFIVFTGGGSALLQHHLHALVSQKRSAQDFFFAPVEVASTLNSIGILGATYGAAQHLQERLNHAATRNL